MTRQRIYEIAESLNDISKNINADSASPVLKKAYVDTAEMLLQASIQLKKLSLAEEMMRETLDEIAEFVEYKPDHDKEFSGDKLLEILKNTMISKRMIKNILSGRKKIHIAHGNNINYLDECTNCCADLTGEHVD